MNVRLLTETQKNELIGQLVQPDWYFNPTQDCVDNWIISEQEVTSCIYPDLFWIRTLPQIEWCPPPPPPIPSGSTIN